MKTQEPMILCELCHSFAVEAGLKEVMDAHRATCDGKVKELLIRKTEQKGGDDDE
jgi:hypothetical protein